MKLRARLFDDKGRFLREESAATWSLDGLKGTVANGAFTVGPDPVEQAGLIKATVGGLTGEARARVVRPLPWKETFESYADGAVPAGWVNAAAGQVSVTTLDGQKVLQKAPTDTIFKRARVFIGPVTWSNYTFEADVRAATRRRQMGDVGITAQRYSLVLYGNSQRLKIEPWEPETARTVTVPFAWKPDTWYRLKLRVENLRERAGPRARQGVAGWRDRAGGVDDRQDRSDWQPRGGAGLLPRRAVRRVPRQLLDHAESAMTMSFFPLARHFCSSPYWHAPRSRRRNSRPRIPAAATGRCGAARPIATWSRT